jgi:hypothetical protein
MLDIVMALYLQISLQNLLSELSCHDLLQIHFEVFPDYQKFLWLDYLHLHFQHAHCLIAKKNSNLYGVL